jgi:hypothetical protein
MRRIAMWFKYLKCAVNWLMGIALVVGLLMLPSDEKIIFAYLYGTQANGDV